MTSHADTVDISKPTNREIRLRRSFEASRQLVYDAHVQPELVKRWLYGPDDWPLLECEIDLRVGGNFRYVWQHKEHDDIGLNGKFLEIMPLERIVHTELFDHDWTGGESRVTTSFSEAGGRTTVSVTILYSSTETRDAVMKTGMIEGWAQGLHRLESLLDDLGDNIGA